jgi:hypothetical protein
VRGAILAQETKSLKPTLTENQTATTSTGPFGTCAALSPLFPWPLLIIMAAAFAVVLPFLFLGNPSGHDFEFHLNSWMEVLSQWKQGILYPRWAAFAHYGYGEARFVFYPPASWMLGAALGAFLPWKSVPGVYVWLALTLSGCSMFLLGRRWLEPRDAIFASALYAANPYYIVIVYWRSAFAELLAGALLPLLLLCVLRSEVDQQKAILPLSLVVAAAWLTNAPAAVMVNYSLALLVVIVAIVQRSPRILLYGAMAVLLGASLAAFYILPAASEQKWVDIAQVLGPGVRPQDNFLFTTLNDADHNRFNLLISLIASAQIIVLVATTFLFRKRRATGRTTGLAPEARDFVASRPPPILYWTLTSWAAVATLLMFWFTFLPWEYLPELRFMQLPWRWLLCLNVAFALLVTLAWRRWPLRILAYMVMLAVVAFTWHRVQPPWWDTAADIAEMEDNQQEGQGYEGTDEYVPAGADASEIKRDALRVSFEGRGTARIHMVEWAPELKYFAADVRRSGRLVLRLFNYPAWRVEVNDRLVAAETREVTGQMMIPVEVGENRVRITFARTWDRTAGGIVSGVTVLLMVTLVVFQRKWSLPVSA